MSWYGHHIPETRFVEKYLDTSLLRLTQIGPATPLYKPAIGLARHHHPDINTRCHGRLQRKEDGLRRQEIGRLDIDIALGRQDDAQIALHNLGIRCQGRRRDGLEERAVSIFRRLGIIALVTQLRAVHEIPVDEEGTLQGVDTTTLDAHHRVAPSSLMTALHIAQGEIHATDIAYPAIDDENLTMVAVVHLTCKRGETYGHEGFHLDSLDTHPLKETVVHAPASHGIIEHTHLHALTSLGYQGIRDESSQGIVLKDIDINMDMVPRRGDVTQQRRE